MDAVHSEKSKDLYWRTVLNASRKKFASFGGNVSALDKATADSVDIFEKIIEAAVERGEFKVQIAFKDIPALAKAIDPLFLRDRHDTVLHEALAQYFTSFMQVRAHVMGFAHMGSVTFIWHPFPFPN